MATWPAKTDFAAGAVLTATQMNTIGGELNDVYTSYSKAAGKNAVINGGFDIWQRGTSFSLAASTAVSAGYTADRWGISNGANQALTVSRQATNDTTNLPNIQYALRYQRNSGQTGTGPLYLAQSFETVNSIPLAGKSATLSFYARAGANYSATSSTFTASVFTGTGTDENRLSVVYTGNAQPITNNVTLTTTWQRFTITGTLASNITELCVLFGFTPTGTAGANDYFEVTGVQLELGSTATPFSRAGGTIQGELAACQRYYWRFGGQDANQIYGLGIATGTTTASIPVQNPVTMRTAPTSIDFSTLGTSDLTAFTNAITTLTIAVAANNIVRLSASGGSGMTLKTPVTLQNTAIGGYLGISAEL